MIETFYLGAVAFTAFCAAVMVLALVCCWLIIRKLGVLAVQVGKLTNHIILDKKAARELELLKEDVAADVAALTIRLRALRLGLYLALQRRRQ